MEITLKMPEDAIEMFAVTALVNSRELLLEEIECLGPQYAYLPKYRQEDFREAIELFDAADRMLQYYTTEDQYQALLTR